MCSSIFGSQTISSRKRVSREITRVAERCARKQIKQKIPFSDSALFWVWKAVSLYGLVKLRWLFQISSLKTNLIEVENWTWQKRAGMWVLGRMNSNVEKNSINSDFERRKLGWECQIGPVFGRFISSLNKSVVKSPNVRKLIEIHFQKRVRRGVFCYFSTWNDFNVDFPKMC